MASFRLQQKRVLVYANGQSADTAQYCWASNLEELNDTAKVKLRLNKPIKFFFTKDGKMVMNELKSSF